jgi:glycosyltransferase involved in cell wall biosynthesis
MPRRVLVVAYNFPPVGGVGMHRTLKYVTYLPMSGWQPVVVTARNPGQRPWDIEAQQALPAGLQVGRAWSPEPVKLRRLLATPIRALRRRPKRIDVPSASTGANASSTQRASGAGNRGLIRGFVEWIWASFVRLAFFPDQQALWAPFAARAAGAANKSQAIDAIYSSSGPISSHLAAGLVARRTHLPWVADYRDPWIGNAFAANLPLWQRPFQRRLDRWIVGHADRVVFVSDGVLKGYRDLYPWAAGKMVVIPNGYDRNDFPAELRATIAARRAERANQSEANDARHFLMVYAGAIYGEHELEIFLEGLERLLARRPELRARLRVEFIGQLNVHNKAVAAGYDRPERLAEVVSYSGFLPHEVALAHMARADVLFNVIADEPGKWRIPSGKLSEYVGLDAQIVAFVPEGSARDLLRELDWGILADPTPEGVADGIERALGAPPPARPADPEGRYDRVNLTGRLAKLLDEVVAERAARSR